MEEQAGVKVEGYKEWHAACFLLTVSLIFAPPRAVLTLLYRPPSFRFHCLRWAMVQGTLIGDRPPCLMCMDRGLWVNDDMLQCNRASRLWDRDVGRVPVHLCEGLLALGSMCL